MTFSIAWEVEPMQWDVAAATVHQHERGSEYDVSLYALDELLPGMIRFREDEQPLRAKYIPHEDWSQFSLWQPGNHPVIPTSGQIPLVQGVDLLVFDFAWQIAMIMTSQGFASAPEGSTADYKLAVDALVLRFIKVHGSVKIASNTLQERGWILDIAEKSFFTGTERFLSSFAKTIEENLPEIAVWKTWEPFLPFLLSSSSGI